MHGKTIEHTRLPDGKVADVYQLLDLAFGLRQYFPHLQRDQRAQIFFPLAEGGADLPDHFAALRGRDIPPLLKAALAVCDTLS